MGFDSGVKTTRAQKVSKNRLVPIRKCIVCRGRGKMKKNYKRTTAIVSIAISSAMLLAIGQTSASQADSTLQAQSENWESIQRSTDVDQSCMNQIRPQAQNASEADLEKICTVTTVLKSRVDVANPSTTGIRALALGPVYSKTWEINKIGITYFEVAKGRFYFDGSKAWSTKLYRGYKGFFDCQAPGSWGFTVQVTVEDCSTTYINNGGSVVDRETYKVSAFVSGFPIYWVYAMSQLSKADGTTTSRDF